MISDLFPYVLPFAPTYTDLDEFRTAPIGGLSELWSKFDRISHTASQNCLKTRYARTVCIFSTVMYVFVQRGYHDGLGHSLGPWPRCPV